MRYITIALAKGRLAEISIELFEKIGLDIAEMKTKTRKLIFVDETYKLKFVMVKASDVPTYVEYGAADIGIVGKDTLIEECRNLYEMINLKFGACKMVVAGPESMREKLKVMNDFRVATKYVRVAKDYFYHQKNKTIEIIKLNGSVELAPLVGLSEVIVDIVESGKTLKENGLVVLEEICDLSARFVVNRVSMKMEKERIMDIVTKLRDLQEQEGNA
ncbi:MAG: ATP phosphoribosyltransferase [Hyphomonadaceae bacterium]|nr:ATP phosphoribosyltransferase [Clostridia bacterium]